MQGLLDLWLAPPMIIMDVMDDVRTVYVIRQKNGG